MTASGSAVSPTMDLLVSRCQVLAGRFLDTSASDLLTGIEQIAADVPLEDLTVPERMMAGMVLVRVLSHWIRRSQLVSVAPVGQSLIELGTLPLNVHGWRARWACLLDLCGNALGTSGNSFVPAARGNPRAALLLGVIRARFHESTLCLGGVAAAAHVSPWHATRLLARETGRSFVVHLRQQRVAAAQRLLEETALSVKEIAARTGYSNVRGLTRDIKRLHGTTPTALRFRSPA